MRAVVHAEAKREVLVGAAADVEGVWVLEHIFVTVGRRIRQQHRLAGLDGATAKFIIDSGRAHEVFHRGGPADHFVGGGSHQRRVGLKACQLIGILDEGQHSARHRRRRGVVTGCGRDDVIADGVHHREWVAIDSCICNCRSKVVGGLSAARFGERREVDQKVLNHCEEIGGVATALHFFVGRAEHLWGELEHAVVIGLGQTKNGQDHVERHLHAHVAGEVAAVALLGHPVDEAAGDLADPPFQRPQVLRQQRALGHAAIGEVVGIIHLHQRAHQVRRAAHHLADLLVGLDGGDDRGAVAVVEQLVLTLDLEAVEFYLPAHSVCLQLELLLTGDFLGSLAKTRM